MRYLSCEEYKNNAYPKLWQKINSTLGFIEHPEDRNHWPPFKGNDSRNPILNIIFHLVSSKKITRPKNIKWFIETGTCNAFTTMHFSSLFEKVDTVEKYKPDDPRLPENFYKKVKDNFKNINFYKGDSVPFLKQILKEEPNQRACFWLDAHNSIHEVPLLDEIRAIKDTSLVQDHLILIDDADDCGQGNFPAYPTVLESIKEINPDYIVERINHCRGIIAAYV